MISASRILKIKKEAQDTLNYIFNNKNYCLVIHYSCESFYNRPDGRSPRITSIAVRNLLTGQTKSFSIHQFAEVDNIAFKDISQSYNNLEKKMLSAFYNYVNQNLPMKWIHWNMRDINYGFEAIAHRFRVLGGEPIEIRSKNLIDLARLLISLYNVNYVGHPRLEKLMELNRITKLSFLNGAEEAQAFDNHDFVKLHQSTLRKVDIFSNIIERLEAGSLAVNSKWYDTLKLYPQLWAETIQNHWLFSLISICVVSVGFLLYLKDFSAFLEKWGLF